MPFPSLPVRATRAFAPRVLLTLLLAWAAASLCVWLRTPLPWMIGPLLATAVVSMLGGPTASWTPLRNTGQWVIGCALGLYFTPQVVALLAGLWWAIALNIAWALALGLAFGAWLYRLHHAELSRRRHVRQIGDACAATDRERTQLAGLDVAEQNRHVGKHHLHMTAEQIVHGGCGTGVRRMDKLDAGGELEQFHVLAKY